jgi:hypothetical protein
MKKISTLYKKDPNDLSRVVNEIDPENAWAVLPENLMSKATRKFDGTACAIIDGQLYKRYDVKKGKSVPPFAISCQEPDPITGHWPHWILCQHDKPEDRWHFEGLDNLEEKIDGTYELCGPKVQGNPEKFVVHTLVPHGDELLNVGDLSFEGIKAFLMKEDIEGIVFHNHIDGRMCKIRKSDFGIKR